MKSCFSRIGGCLLGLVLIAGLLVAAVNFLLLPRLDGLLADSVRREFMLPPSAEVEIRHGTLAETLRGRITSFSVRSPEGKIEDVVVEDIAFDAEGVQFDLPRTLLSEQAELKGAEKATLSLRISEDAVEQRWAEELGKKGLEKVELSFEDGNKVEISGLLDIRIAKIPVAASGSFIVDGSNRIQFEARDFAVGGADIGLAGFKSALSMLTPVINLGQFNIYVSVEEMHAEDGYLLIRARSMSDAEREALAKEHPEFFSEETGKINISLGRGLNLEGQQAELRAQLEEQFSARIAALRELGESEQAAELQALLDRFKLDQADMTELRQAYDKFMPELKEKGSELLDKLAELGRQISGGGDKDATDAGGGEKNEAPPAEDENGK